MLPGMNVRSGLVRAGCNGAGVSALGGCADARAIGFLVGAGARDVAGAAAGLFGEDEGGGVFGAGHFEEDVGVAQGLNLFWVGVRFVLSLSWSCLQGLAPARARLLC